MAFTNSINGTPSAENIFKVKNKVIKPEVESAKMYGGEKRLIWAKKLLKHKAYGYFLNA